MTTRIVGFITATNISQTVDFTSLAVGDIVQIYPSPTSDTAPDSFTITVNGDLGRSAVVGCTYLIRRAV